MARGAPQTVRTQPSPQLSERWATRCKTEVTQHESLIFSKRSELRCTSRPVKERPPPEPCDLAEESRRPRRPHQSGRRRARRHDHPESERAAEHHRGQSELPTAPCARGLARQRAGRVPLVFPRGCVHWVRGQSRGAAAARRRVVGTRRRVLPRPTFAPANPLPYHRLTAAGAAVSPLPACDPRSSDGELRPVRRRHSAALRPEMGARLHTRRPLRRRRVGCTLLGRRFGVKGGQTAQRLLVGSCVPSRRARRRCGLGGARYAHGCDRRPRLHPPLRTLGRPACCHHRRARRLSGRVGSCQVDGRSPRVVGCGPRWPGGIRVAQEPRRAHRLTTGARIEDERRRWRPLLWLVLRMDLGMILGLLPIAARSAARRRWRQAAESCKRANIGGAVAARVMRAAGESGCAGLTDRRWVTRRWRVTEILAPAAPPLLLESWRAAVSRL